MNRPSMMAALPEMLRMLKSRQSNETAGQRDMFGSSKAPGLRIPELADWSLDEKLWYERKSTGGFFSGHPTDSVRAKRMHEITHEAVKLAELLEYGTHGDIVVCGLVSAVWPRNSSTTIQIEDRSGRAEVFFNRKARDRYMHLLVQDYILMLRLEIWHGERGSAFDVVKAAKVGQFVNPASALSRGNKHG